MHLVRQLNPAESHIQIPRDDSRNPAFSLRDQPKTISPRVQPRARIRQKEIIIGFKRGEQKVHKQVQRSDRKKLSLSAIDKLTDPRRRRCLKVPSANNQSKKLIRLSCPR